MDIDKLLEALIERKTSAASGAMRVEQALNDRLAEGIMRREWSPASAELVTGVAMVLAKALAGLVVMNKCPLTNFDGMVDHALDATRKAAWGMIDNPASQKMREMVIAMDGGREVQPEDTEKGRADKAKEDASRVPYIDHRGGPAPDFPQRDAPYRVQVKCRDGVEFDPISPSAAAMLRWQWIGAEELPDDLVGWRIVEG